MRFFLSIALLYCFSNSFAQNLISNPGFEDLNAKPSRFTAKAADFDSCMNNWFTTNLSSPDIISPQLSDKTRSYTIPKAHTGEAMVGLINNLGMWCEYISTELNSPIESGKTYYAEVWYMVLVPQNSSTVLQASYENPQFGFWFNQGKKIRSKGYIVEQPQVSAAQTTLLTPYEWRQLSGTFTAEEDFTHLSLGQFEAGSNKVLNGCIVIDDIIVRETDPPALEVGATIVLENVIFKSGTAILESESYASLEELYGQLKQDKNLHIAINGHTDNVGSEEANLLLSEQRAATIHQYLVDKNIDAARLKYQGYGEGQPITTNETSSGRKKNRRVEFEILSKS